MRIVYSVFKAQRGEFSDLKRSFTDFRLKWNTTKKPRHVLSIVLSKIQQLLPVGRNILLIVDEAANTKQPKQVRNLLYNTWIQDNTMSRLIMSSLDPGIFANLGSDPVTRWVPVMVPTQLVARQITESCTWLNDVDEKARLLTAYLLDMAQTRGLH